MGAKKRRHKGSARALNVERFLRSKTRRAVRRSLAELSERPLRGGLPVLHCCPFARFAIARQESKEPNHRDVKFLYRQAIFESG